MKAKRDISQEILDGLDEIKAWQSGKKRLKTTEISMPTAHDVAIIRNNLGLSQESFATLMGVKVATLRNWEQGRREPQGPAKSLLLIAKKMPSIFLKMFYVERKTA